MQWQLYIDPRGKWLHCIRIGGGQVGRAKNRLRHTDSKIVSKKERTIHHLISEASAKKKDLLFLIVSLDNGSVADSWVGYQHQKKREILLNWPDHPCPTAIETCRRGAELPHQTGPVGRPVAWLLRVLVPNRCQSCEFRRDNDENEPKPNNFHSWFLHLLLVEFFPFSHPTNVSVCLFLSPPSLLWLQSPWAKRVDRVKRDKRKRIERRKTDRPDWLQKGVNEKEMRVQSKCWNHRLVGAKLWNVSPFGSLPPLLLYTLLRLMMSSMTQDLSQI